MLLQTDGVSVDVFVDLVREGGALVLAIIVIVALVKEWVVTKGRLDDQKALVKEATEGWKKQQDVNEKMADALEERNDIDKGVMELLREQRK